MSKSLKPDFICASPHKTGTTWLYVALKSHPKVWLPPKKELWFFNQMGEPYTDRWRNFFRRTGMPGDNRRSFEEDIYVRFKQNIFKRQNRAALWWWLKFLFLPYTFDTYPCLFPRNPNLLSGDITPNYYFLKLDMIQQLSQYNPNIRIMLILRNPVERAWSYTRMDISGCLQKPFDDISYSEFAQYFDRLHCWWKPYLHSIRVWKEHFQQVYVGYFDALQENPYRFYEQICDFLGIDSSDSPQNLKQVVYRGRVAVLPLELRKYLNRQYTTEIRELAEWSNGPYPEKWLKEIEQERSP